LITTLSADPLWFTNRQVRFSPHPLLDFLLIPAKLAKKTAPHASQDRPSLQHQSLRLCATSNKEAQTTRLLKNPDLEGETVFISTTGYPGVMDAMCNKNRVERGFWS